VSPHLWHQRELLNHISSLSGKRQDSRPRRQKTGQKGTTQQGRNKERDGKEAIPSTEFPEDEDAIYNTDSPQHLHMEKITQKWE